MKTASLVLRIVTVALLVGVLINLLMSTGILYTEKTWGISSYGDRVDLDPVYSSGSTNFFGAIRIVRNNGFGTTKYVLTAVLFFATLALSFVAIFVRVLRKPFFAAAPLALAVLLFIVGTSNHSYGMSDLEYLGSAYGYSVYTQTYMDIYLRTPLVTAGAFAVAAALTYALGGVFFELSQRASVAESAPRSESPDNTAKTEKLKELLDAGIITDEEYEAKLAQLSPAPSRVDSEANDGEIEKLKALLDAGIITDEEYDAKLAQLSAIKDEEAAECKSDARATSAGEFDWLTADHLEAKVSLKPNKNYKFHRAEGLAGAVPQSFIDRTFKKCPLCRSHTPYWSITEQASFAATGNIYLFKCSACEAIISMTKPDVCSLGNGGVGMAANLTVGVANLFVKKAKGKESGVVYAIVESVGTSEVPEEIAGREYKIDVLKSLAE